MQVNSALRNLFELAEEIQDSDIVKCHPEDDPAKQYAYAAEFRDLAFRFIGGLRLLNNPNIQVLLGEINPDIDTNYIVEAHELRSKLLPVADFVLDIAENPEKIEESKAVENFVETEILKILSETKHEKFDLKKLVKFLEELNDSYQRENFLSAILLLRAVLNHIPPIFDVETFPQVVAKLGKSEKAVISRLQDEARPIADLHTHQLIRRIELLPTKTQIDPYKTSLEILLHAIITRVA